MKRNLLFAVLCTIAWVNTYAADWTDKTSLITNPSFETYAAISDLTSCGWATDRVTGWTIAPSSPGNAQVGVGNSSSTIQGIAKSFSPSAGDKYFYMRENWNPNTTFSISQTIADGSIPAGIYRLTVKAAMFSSVASTYTLSLQEEGQTAATNSFSYAGTSGSESWRDWSVMLIKQADNTDLIITASYKTPSENSAGKHYTLLLDDFKLEYINPTEDVSSTNTFDMTSWIVNPSFELNTWTGTQADGSSIGNSGGTINKPTGYTCYFDVEGWRDCNSNTTAPADGTYCMNAWFGTIREQKFYQTIGYLPEGVYEISAQVRTDQTSTDGIYTYGIAGGNTYKSDSWDASKMAGTWNSMGNWQTLTARASIVGSGSLQFGVRSDKFIQFDDFHLTYLGNDLLLTDLKSTFSSLQSTATTDLESATYTNITGSERTALTNAKNATPEETVAAWNDAITTLSNAISAFEAAKTNYDKLAAEITKATALGIDASSYAATSSTTAATALTNTQSLKVDEYNYVNTTYAFGVDLGTWTTEGYTADNSGQHWDGTNGSKYKEQENSWGTPKKGYAADSWSIKFYQSIELPAGNYVFKVAGRKASGSHTTMSLDVTKTSDDSSLGTINDFPEGDTGLGINTSGETDFTTGDGHAYANSGNGRGWEWRYVKFTLSEDTEVKIAVNADADATSQWMSFCNYTLQTDDNTNISLIAYNIALSSAQTVIEDDTYENVTGSEKTDLQDAIDADENLDKDNKDDIDAATEALDNARTAFTEAKSNYDAYVAAKAVLYPTLAYATTAKRTALDNAQDAAAATSASDADSKTAAIQTAARQYYESHALAEGVTGAENKTSLISDPNMEVTYDGTNHTFGAWQVIGQTDGAIQLLDGESFTDGSGNNNYKYADIYKGDNNGGIQQTISDLAPGKYMLTVTARAQATAGATFGVFAGTDRTEITRIGNSGGVFDRGWNDFSVIFCVRETSDVNIGVQSGNGKSLWWSATRFRLVKLPTTEIEIDETKAWTPVADDFADVTLNRKIKIGHNTLVLPFDMTQEEVEAKFGTGSKVFEVDSYADGKVTFEDRDGIQANQPVLLKATAEGSSYTINSRDVKVATPTYTANEGEETEVSMIGSYAAVTSVGSGEHNYIISNNMLYLVDSDNVKVKNTRAYFNIPNVSSVKSLMIAFDDDIETAISTIENGELKIENAPVYNLAGQRVSKAQKGIYIVNGKKIVKK